MAADTVSVGMNDVQLDAFAARLDHAAQDLEGMLREGAGGVLLATMGTAMATIWRGPRAEDFANLWRTRHLVKLQGLRTMLHDAARDARKEASQQRDASKVDGGDSRLVSTATNTARAGAGTVLFGLTMQQRTFLRKNLSEYESGEREFLPSHLAQLPELRWAVSAGRAELLATLALTPTAQLAWWGGLSKERQDALMFLYPDKLSAMHGLPLEAQRLAARSYVDQQASHIELSGTKQTIRGETDLGVVKLGVEGSAAETLTADGRVRVDLSLTGDIGKHIGAAQGGAGVGVSGGVTSTYVFANQAQADAFLAQFKHELTRVDSGDALALAGGGGMGLAAAKATEMMKFLNDYSTNQTALVADAQVKLAGGLELAGQKVEVSGAVGGSHDFKSGETTVYVELSGDAKVGSLDVGGSGKLAVTYDSAGHVTSASVTLTGHVDSGASASAWVEDMTGAKLVSTGASVSHGGEVQVHASIDMQDPVAQQRLLDVLKSGGDPAAVRAVLARSEASVVVNQTASTVRNYEIAGTGVKITDSSSSNVVTFIKPPDGSFINATAELTASGT